MKVARSAGVAGGGGTSNVAAAMRYGLQPVGTMAHSYVLSFDDEEEAFRSFIEGFPKSTVMLVDTYDTLAGGALRDLRGPGRRHRAGRRAARLGQTCWSSPGRRGASWTRRE